MHQNYSDLACFMSTTMAFIFCTEVPIWKSQNRTARLQFQFHSIYISKIWSAFHFNRLLRIINWTFLFNFFYRIRNTFNFLSRLGGENDFICSTQMDKLSEALHRRDALIQKNVEVSLKKVPSVINIDRCCRQRWRQNDVKNPFSVITRFFCQKYSFLVFIVVQQCILVGIALYLLCQWSNRPTCLAKLLVNLKLLNALSNE